MVITPPEVVAIFRREADDLPLENGDTAGCLWSNEDIYRYMNSAAATVARRAVTLYKIFELDITAGEPLIKMPAERIYKVRRAYTAAGPGRELQQLNLGEDFITHDYGVRLNTASWQTNTGPSNSFVLDYRPGYIRLYPVPTADDTLVIHAQVLPAVIKATDTSFPFVADEDIQLMLLWMKKLAYDKHDADASDAAVSMRYEREFDSRVQRRDAEFRRQTHGPGVVRSIW